MLVKSLAKTDMLMFWQSIFDYCKEDYSCVFGWLLIGIGASFYFLCLINFLTSGGTPAIFFIRPLRFVVGEEPPKLVRQGLYRFTRNPMYVGVVTVILGQALVFSDLRLFTYAAVVWLGFHLFVLIYEEPTLSQTFGASYDVFRANVPRWVPRLTPWRQAS